MMPDEKDPMDPVVMPGKERKNLIKGRKNNGGTYLDNEESMLPGSSMLPCEVCMEMPEEGTLSESIDE